MTSQTSTALPKAMIPTVLKALGWKAVEDGSKWIDPNQPDNRPCSIDYAWYVSQMRVQNRTDTKHLKVTNQDLAEMEY